MRPSIRLLPDSAPPAGSRALLARTGRRLVFLAVFLALAGCSAPAPEPQTADPWSTWSAAPDGEQIEVPPSPEGWRGHRLSRCPPEQELPPRVRQCLEKCGELFAEGSGSDGMVELEICLADGLQHPLLLLTLGQLYLMGGQGEPSLLPSDGPAADVGDWQRNRVRLLDRAYNLLEQAAEGLPDEAGVDYLLADVARARGRFELADNLVARGLSKCTGGTVFGILRFYQRLNRYPARMHAAPAPDYPQAAVQAGLSGTVELDLLLSPAGTVTRIEPVQSPGPALFAAAAEAFRQGTFEPARVGKYPVWSWLRVKTNFRLQEN